MSLRVIFMGTPDFAVPALQAIHTAGHHIVGVYCQPPKPAGRGLQLKKSAVQECAESLGIAVFTPKTLRAPEVQEQFHGLKADVAVVAAYGLILPKAILDSPRYGCINIHGSLLPRWRGAAPIQRALLEGDTETGITIMQMDEGLDTGTMLLMESLPITAHDTAQSLHDSLACIGSSLIALTLDKLQQGTLSVIPQPDVGVTYAAKLTRTDGHIDWYQDAVRIERQFRALHPWPGVHFNSHGEDIKVLAMEIVDGNGHPGEILDSDMTIACSNGAVRLIRVQRPGKAPISGQDLMNGLRLKCGDHLDRATV